MFDPRIIAFLRRAARRAGRPESETPDADLLDRFVHVHDATAFDELVTRHGPAVYALCRRLLRSEADTEDVFQAAFLVLARDAGRVRKAASVGSWLHRVAFRLARKARARRNRPLPDPARLVTPAPPLESAEFLTWAEVREALDEELARLPDNLRAPLLLCFFRGMTQDEAAAELGWKTRTLKARVARGRARLRSALERRGIELQAVLAAPLLAAGVTAIVPLRVTAGLVSAAVDFALSQPPAAGVSLAAIELAHSGVSAMTTARTTFLVASAAALMTAGTVLGLRGGLTGPDPQAPPIARAQPPAPVADPLPPGAIARIGTTAFRYQGIHTRVYFPRDGKTLISTDESSKTVRFWDALTGRVVDQFDVADASFRDSDFAPATGMLAAVGLVRSNPPAQSEAVLCLIDTTARKVVHTLRMPDITYSSSQKVRFSSDGKVLVTSIGGELRVWDPQLGVELFQQKTQGGEADHFAVSPDGKTVAFGRRDVSVWKWQSGEEPKKLAAIGSFTELMAFAPDGTLYIQPMTDRPLQRWDVMDGKLLGTLAIGGTSRALAFSPDGKTLAVCYVHPIRVSPNEHSVVLWNLATGAQVGRLSLDQSFADFVNWSADGSKVAATTYGRLWVWDVKSRQPLSVEAPGHNESVSALMFGPDGTLYTGSRDGTVRSWDAATGQAKSVFVQEWSSNGVAVSPDGSLVAGSALRNDLRVWDAKTAAEKFKLLGNGELGGLRQITFSGDGTRLVAWGDDEWLRVWDTRNGKLLAESQPNGPPPDDPMVAQVNLITGRMTSASALSQDGSILALSSQTVVRLIDPVTGMDRLKLDVGASKVAISPDGKRLAVAVRGKPIQTKLPDGRVQMSTANEHMLAVWDLSEKKQVWAINAEGNVPLAIAFSPDGSRLATSPMGSTKPTAIRLWDAATGKNIGRIALSDFADHLAFDRTGKRLAVSQRDTTALVYDLATAIKPPQQ